MAIHKKLQVTEDRKAAEEKFLNGAPDSTSFLAHSLTPSEKGIPKGNKRQISITIDPVLLRKLDAKAAEMGTGRSAFISMAVFKALCD